MFIPINNCIIAENRIMELLFERHAEYLTDVPTYFERELMQTIDWDSRLILIRGPKGVGKSTLMQQYILNHYDVSDRHALYCTADSSYFATHTLVDTAASFVRQGGSHLFIDEIHKYDGWSSEIKEIYDLYKGLRVYLWFRTGKKAAPVKLDYLLSNAGSFCTHIRSLYRPLEYFNDYLRMGYYPFSFEKKKTYRMLIENVTGYIIDSELTKYRGVSPENTRKIKALLQVIAEMIPYQVDISKLSSSVSIDRVTLIRYLRYLNEAKLLKNLFTELDKITDLQKPDKILLDNPNLIYAYSIKEPEIGTVRETFFCNQLTSAGHRVEYGGIKTGDFRIDKNLVIEVGGAGKDFSQINDEDINNAALALDNIDIASPKKIPLWAFGFLY